ncbi:MAG: hypothetical protein QXG48_02125 [Thermofilaceae archaeon]
MTEEIIVAWLWNDEWNIRYYVEKGRLLFIGRRDSELPLDAKRIKKVFRIIPRAPLYPYPYAYVIFYETENEEEGFYCWKKSLAFWWEIENDIKTGKIELEEIDRFTIKTLGKPQRIYHITLDGKVEKQDEERGDTQSQPL